MKACFVFDNLDLSGAEKVAINLLRSHALFARVAVSGVVCMDDRIGCAAVAPRLVHLSADLPPGAGLWSRLRRAFVATLRLRAVARDVDLLVAVTPPMALLAALANLGRRSIVVPWVHYDYTGIRRETWPAGMRLRGWVQRQLYLGLVPRFRHIVFVSRECEQSFAPQRRATSRWQSLPNVFVPGSFVPSAPSRTRTAIGALQAQGVPVLVFIGRLFRQKRWEDAIAMAEKLQEDRFAFHLAFIGDGIEREAFLARLAASPARSYLHYLGPDTNVLPALELADGLVLTSLFEAWPTVILEAFAARVPVFSYDCPSGPAEMLGQGERGTLTAEDPVALARAVSAYFGDDPARRAAMLERAAGYVARFLPDQAAPLWDETLAQLARPLTGVR